MRSLTLLCLTLFKTLKNTKILSPFQSGVPGNEDGGPEICFHLCKSWGYIACHRVKDQMQAGSGYFGWPQNLDPLAEHL